MPCLAQHGALCLLVGSHSAQLVAESVVFGVHFPKFEAHDRDHLERVFSADLPELRLKPPGALTLLPERELCGDEGG